MPMREFGIESDLVVKTIINMATIEEKKLAFVHIPKTGGVSVCVALNMKSDGHWKASQYPTDYYKFTIVRDPVERFESAIAYMKNIRELYHKTIPECYEKYNSIPVNDIANVFMKDEELMALPLFKPQSYFIDNENVEIFKNVQDAFDFVCEKFNFKAQLESLNASPAKEKLTNYSPIKKYYSNDYVRFQL